MTTYPESELINFIRSQPDNRPIDMHQASWDKEAETPTCGCVLVHFGQSKGCSYVNAGFCRINDEHEIEDSSKLILRFLSHSVTTYAQAKALL